MDRTVDELETALGESLVETDFYTSVARVTYLSQVEGQGAGLLIIMADGRKLRVQIQEG